MKPKTTALKEGIEEIPGMDFVTEDENELQFTVMWGGVGEDGYRTTHEGIENFTRTYDVGVQEVSSGPESSTWKVVPEGEVFTFDAIEDVYTP